MTKLQKVLKAIEIQGHVTVRTERGDMKATRVTVGPKGEWITDIPTANLCGYVRIVKTKDAVVEQAEYVIANEAAVRAEREAKFAAAARCMMD